VNEPFCYRAGELFAENVPLARIAEAVGTPAYVYSSASFVAQYRALAAALAPVRPLICYAVKANSNQAVLRLFAGLGRAPMSCPRANCAAQSPPASRRTHRLFRRRQDRAELTAALDADIHQINIESVPELRRLSDIASGRGQIARVAIRVNPDVDAGTHSAISTGREGDKFGIAHGDVAAAYRLAAQLPGNRYSRAGGAYWLEDRGARPVAHGVLPRRRAGEGTP